MRNDVNRFSPCPRQVVIAGVTPQVDAGRFPVLRTVGDRVAVEADVFTDADDELAVTLRYRHGDDDWLDVPMAPAGNDRWRAEFPVEELGPYQYTVGAHAGPWAARLEQPLSVRVDRARAGFGAWYELFPRSASPEPGRHGTLRDVEALLPGIAAMGFDVLAFPPIHPIGKTGRRGRDGRDGGPDDPGSPWAIGSAEGGHTAIHPQLGTLADFRTLLRAAKRFDIEIALELSLQASPDHPWVKAHPDWFKPEPDLWHPDIQRFDFSQLPREAVKGIVDFWLEQGIRLFRVDNPQNQPFGLWEWLIAEVKRSHPETIFAAKSFARPRVLEHLFRVGFDLSYTYFAWRNSKAELEGCCRELLAMGDRFRPIFWPSTADCLPGYLQEGGVAAFEARLVLAGTLAASYGIAGPAYELQWRQAREPGGEEPLDSEKYQLRHWDREQPDSLRDFIARLNRIRRQNPALQANASLRFHPGDNAALLCYSKRAGDNIIVTAVNLDPHQPQAGWVDLAELGLDPGQPLAAHDLISDARYTWPGSRPYVALDPGICPAQVFRLG